MIIEFSTNECFLCNLRIFMPRTVKYVDFIAVKSGIIFVKEKYFLIIRENK